MYKYSVIIPHYNTPRLLEKLLASIPESSDIQIIVVDDKSTKEIEYYKIVVDKYSCDRIRFYSNTRQNKCAGTCRNIGLEKAQGKWLLFADSDDYFMPGFIKLIDKYYDTKADIVYFVPTSVDLETGAHAYRHVAYKQLMDKYIKRGDLRSETEMKYSFVLPWSRMIRREMIVKNNILFDEVPVGNDVLFGTKSAYYANSIVADPGVIYCATRTKHTLTTKKDSKRFDGRIDVFLRRYDFLKKHLDKKSVRYTHIDRIAISHMANSVIYGYGVKKAISIFFLFVRKGIPLFDIGLLNPITLFWQVKTYLAWRLDDRRHQ